MKVLIADDEPFILQGLSVLIDWEAEGCEIVRKATNGMEALDYLRQNSVDLVISDIKMPEMSGLELLEKIRTEKISDAYFIFLSGYNEFAYAQKAMRYSCMDYLLKPVKKEALLERIREIRKKLDLTMLEKEKERRVQEAYLRQCIYDLLLGRQGRGGEQFSYVEAKLGQRGNRTRYIQISLDDITAVEELSAAERFEIRQTITACAEEYLLEDKNHLISNFNDLEEDYEVGFIYREQMALDRNRQEKQFLAEFADYLNGHLPFSVVLLVGKEVESLEKVSRSYSSACTLRSFKGFRTEKNVYYYEEEIHASENKVVLCKQSLDELIRAVEQNDVGMIGSNVDALFKEMESLGMDHDIVSMNINYLLFRMIHLATEQDETVNQEEVMTYISDRVFETGLTRGSRGHLRKFACEYADYLIQLRKNVSRGVLSDIEKEIRENYAENLTLRDLSKKYFINSSYLGQIFRKKYGQSFKDYLTSYRIEEAASQLLKTDKKISQIADEVGYHDTDYFISKFIEQKGCTPSKYRKNAGQTENN